GSLGSSRRGRPARRSGGRGGEGCCSCQLYAAVPTIVPLESTARTTLPWSGSIVMPRKARLAAAQTLLAVMVDFSVPSWWKRRMVICMVVLSLGVSTGSLAHSGGLVGHRAVVIFGHSVDRPAVRAADGEAPLAGVREPREREVCRLGLGVDLDHGLRRAPGAARGGEGVAGAVRDDPGDPAAPERDPGAGADLYVAQAPAGEEVGEGHFGSRWSQSWRSRGVTILPHSQRPLRLVP